MRKIKIGDTVTICGKTIKLLRIDGEYIVYEIWGRTHTYGLKTFKQILDNYYYELEEGNAK